jgi:hypothetical protein
LFLRQKGVAAMVYKQADLRQLDLVRGWDGEIRPAVESGGFWNLFSPKKSYMITMDKQGEPVLLEVPVRNSRGYN